MGVHTPSWYILSSKATADIGYDALIPSVIFTALAACVVVLRIYCRAHHRSLAAEDLLIFLALLLSGAITGQVGGEFFLRGGYIKNNRLRADVLYKMLNHVFSQSIFYHLAINFVKASFVIQYYRLFSHIRTMVYCCYMLLVVIFGAACWGVFGVVFLCQPIKGYWNVLVPSECMDAETHFWSSSIIGIVLDWTVWFLPMPVVGRLRLPYRQKVGLFVVFGLGGFVCIVSILRFVLVYYFAHHGQVSKSGSYALIWSILELNIAIICASLLVLKPLYARFLPSMISEQPVSAREDARLWREATGPLRLQTSLMDVEKWLNEDDDGRRDTVIGRVERHPRALLAESQRSRQIPRPRRAEVHPRRISW